MRKVIPRVSLRHISSFRPRAFCSQTNGSSDPSAYTHFGFQTVKVEDKVKLVSEVFHKTAETYDLMNDVMSVGIHRWWKDEFIKMLSPTLNMHLLDVAGGTGDIAFRYVETIKNLEIQNARSKGILFEGEEQIKSSSKITILDINPSMLNVGKERAKAKGYLDENASVHIRMDFMTADAHHLPYPDNSFDAYTIAFGIRNCTDVPKVVAEAHRVLKKGGRFLCLEFSHVNTIGIKEFYDFYSFNVIPPMGALVANDWNSYQYLVESIRQFPSVEAFADIIHSAGFSSVSYKTFNFGIVAVHSGFKL